MSSPGIYFISQPPNILQFLQLKHTLPTQRTPEASLFSISNLSHLDLFYAFVSAADYS